MKIRRMLQRINPFVKYKYVVVFIIVLLLAVAGSLTGYSAYFLTSGGLSSCSEELETTQGLYEGCVAKAESLTSGLQTAQTELSSCLSQVSTDLTQCIKEKQALMDENKGLSDFLATCRVSEAEANVSQMIINLQLLELTEAYNSLVGNVAKDICCMRKILFPELNFKYYYIFNNTVVCTPDFDESLETKEFSC